MAPRGASTFASMLDSDDSDEEVMPKQAPTQTDKAPQKAKPRKRKPASKRLSGGRRRNVKATKPTSHAPADQGSILESTLEESQLEQSLEAPDEQEQVGDMEEDLAEQPQKKRRGRPPKNLDNSQGKPSATIDKSAEKATLGKRTQPKEVVANESEEEVTSAPTARSQGRGRPKKAPEVEDVEDDAQAAPRRRGRPKKNKDAEEAPDTETVPAADIGAEEADQEDESINPEESRTEAPPASPARNKKRGPGARKQSPSTILTKRKRGEGDDDSDIEDHLKEDEMRDLRRKLDHTTRRCEVLQSSYEKLQNIGIKQAEANFDKLKERSKAQADAAEKLITSLKADLKTAHDGNVEAEALRKSFDQSESKRREAQRGLEKLEKELSAAKQTNRDLQAKLSAARQSVATAVNERVPGSAVKGKGKADNVAAAKAAAIATLKEELYTDLTGLIIRDVEQTEEADVFDCIQTGRNGTLHFLLAIDKSDPNASYEDTEFGYAPRLDEKRDSELIDILPDFLADEIAFPRASATKFFSRIWDTLTRKLE